MRRIFIKNWRAALKHYSTIALGVTTALQSSLAGLPQEVIDSPLPFTEATIGQLLVALSVCVVLLGLIGKFIDQTPAEPWVPRP